jgi:oxazoline/thiazoline dehydrogenase
VSSLVLSLRPGVSVTSRADELEFQGEVARISFKRVAPAVCKAMEQFAHSGVREDEMTDAVIQAGGADQLPRMYYYLQRLTQIGVLLRSARYGETMLATLTPTSRWFAFDERQIEPECRYVLSRFAYMRQLGNELVMESPLAHAKLTLHDWRAAALVQHSGYFAIDQ